MIKPFCPRQMASLRSGMLLVAVFMGCTNLFADCQVKRVLPSETLFYLATNSFSALNDQLSTTPLAAIWDEPAMKPFRDAVGDDSLGFEATILRNYGLDIDSMSSVQIGELVVAGFATSNGSLSLSFLIETPDATAAQQMQQQFSEKLAETGAIRMPKSITAEAITMQLADLPGEDVTLVTLENVLLVSGDQGIATMLYQRWQTSADQGLDANEHFLASSRGFQQLDGPSLHLFMTPVPLAVALEVSGQLANGAPSKQDDGGPRPPFPTRHGFPGLKAIAAQLWIPDSGSSYQAEIQFLAPGPLEMAMRIFDFPPIDFEPPRFVPADASVVSQFSWNLLSVSENLADLYDDVFDTPGAFRETLDGFRDELRVDFEEEILANIGPELVSFSRYDSETRIEGSIFSFEINDPEKNSKTVASAIYGLLNEDTETVRRRIAGQRYELWQMGLVAGDGTAALTSAGVMVANGRLWLATHASMLEKLLAEESTSVVDTPAYSMLRKAATHGATEGEFGTTFSRVDADLQNTYVTLRTGGMEALRKAENLYAKAIVKAVDKLEFEPKVDFGLLPEYDEIRKHLGLMAVQGIKTPDGWRAVVLGLPSTIE